MKGVIKPDEISHCPNIRNAIVDPIAAIVGVKLTLIIAASMSLISVIWPLTISSIRKLSYYEGDSGTNIKINN
jgi:hypothetical protein